MTRPTRSVTATEFKAKCLALFEEVGESGMIVTRQGRAVAQVVPSQGRPLNPRPNLAHLFEYIGDIETPLDLEWKAMK